MFESLQTATNEIGQIRVQALTGSDSHEQLDPALTAMANTMKDRGQAGPDLAFSDRPKQDKPFLLAKFESLQKKQAELDALAATLNSQEAGDTSITFDTVDVELPDASSVCDKGKEGDNEGDSDSASFQVVESPDINDKIDSMREQVEVEEKAMYPYGFDCEWDTEPTAHGDGHRKVGKVALAQTSYTINGETKALLLKLPRNSEKLPTCLMSFLIDSKALFVGFNISNDFNLIGNDYGAPSLSSKVNSLNLGMMARDRDIVQRGNHSCDEIV